MSARFDLVTYQDYKKNVFSYVIELKAKNPPLDSIKKDVKKIIDSNLPSIWFHTIENINSGTIPKVINKFNASFDYYDNILNTNTAEITIYIAIISQNKLLSSTFYLKDWRSGLQNFNQEI